MRVSPISFMHSGSEKDLFLCSDVRRLRPQIRGIRVGVVESRLDGAGGSMVQEDDLAFEKGLGSVFGPFFSADGTC